MGFHLRALCRRLVQLRPPLTVTSCSSKSPASHSSSPRSSLSDTTAMTSASPTQPPVTPPSRSSLCWARLRRRTIPARTTASDTLVARLARNVGPVGRNSASTACRRRRRDGLVKATSTICTRTSRADVVARAATAALGALATRLTNCGGWKRRPRRRCALSAIPDVARPPAAPDVIQGVAGRPRARAKWSGA